MELGKKPEGTHEYCSIERCSGVHPREYEGPETAFGSGFPKLPPPEPIATGPTDLDRCPRVSREPSYPWDYLRGLGVGMAPAWFYAASYDTTPEDRAAIAMWNRSRLST